MSRFWTEDEVNTLLQNAHLGVERLAPMIGRTPTAINTMASKRRLALGRCAPVSRITSREGFLAHVEFDTNGGCWLWPSYLTQGGYGSTTIDGRYALAHRLAYRLWHGEPGDLMVCHRCDVRACVNPDHLFLGTHIDNMRDMAAKGRAKTPRGEDRKESVLTNHQAAEIKWLMAEGIPTRVLAPRYGVKRRIIYNIKQGITWRHIVPQRPTEAALTPSPSPAVRPE